MACFCQLYCFVFICFDVILCTGVGNIWATAVVPMCPEVQNGQQQVAVSTVTVAAVEKVERRGSVGGYRFTDVPRYPPTIIPPIIATTAGWSLAYG